MPTRAPRFRPPRPARGRDETKAERDAFYSSARWMRLRAAFLADNPVCEDCLARDVATPATVAHHVEERLANPRRALDRSNLMALCNPCHSARHKSGKGSPATGPIGPTHP